ncbi:DUF2726 domain-containing protein [Sinorhizobium fredii]|nr:DUF2726 domain-containing protein [Sinorhizobium fredii]
MGSSFTIQPLLNKSEARVFRELDHLVIGCNPTWQVMAQVSLGEILRSKDANAFSCINAKRVDLLLVDGNCQPRHAIEYQGGAHHQGAAAARDAVKKEALRRAEIGCYEVVAGQTTPSDLSGPWSITLEWTDKDRLLGEPRPTQVDALALGSMAALVIECKFTEPGGKCSPPARSHLGKPQCNGSYVEQDNPTSGVRSRCALAGTAAVAAFADHPSFPTARKAKLGLIDARYSSGKAAVTPISFQGIIEIARRVGLDQQLWADLSAWVDKKIAKVSSRGLDGT